MIKLIKTKTDSIIHLVLSSLLLLFLRPYWYTATLKTSGLKDSSCEETVNIPRLLFVLFSCACPQGPRDLLGRPANSHSELQNRL